MLHQKRLATTGDQDQKEWIRREKNKREQKKKRETAGPGEDEEK